MPAERFDPRRFGTVLEILPQLRDLGLAHGDARDRWSLTELGQSAVDALGLGIPLRRFVPVEES